MYGISHRYISCGDATCVRDHNRKFTYVRSCVLPAGVRASYVFTHTAICLVARIVPVAIQYPPDIA